MSANPLPFTERYNPLASHLDGLLSPGEFLRTLRACDGQIFTGFRGELCLADSTFTGQVGSVVEACKNFWHDLFPKEKGYHNMTSHDPSSHNYSGVIVFSGCGTSGRIGYLVATRFNNIINSLYNAQISNKRDLFAYNCAGGDSALLLSDEMPEDDPSQGYSVSYFR